MYQRTVLDNGLRIASETVPYARSVSVAIFVGAGSRYESEERAGVFHFIEHLCFKGTSRRATAKDISEAIEGVGGVFNAGTDKEFTVYWCKVTPQHFGLALDVLSDIIRYSRFDPADMEKERRVIIEEINSGWDSPQYRVDTLIDEILWPEQPLGRDRAGNKESVSALARSDLLDSLAHQYSPDNVVVSIAGNVTHVEVVDRVREAFGDWRSGGPLSWQPVSDKQEAPRLSVEVRDIEQAHLCLGVKALPLNHPDRFALGLLNTILGGGMSSRLFTEIREKRGLAYSVYSSVEHFFDSGSLVIYAGVAPENIPVAIEAILEEVSNLKDGITEAELSRAKILSKGRLLLRMEDTYAVASWLGAQELLLRKILTVDEASAAIDAIQMDDVLRVARNLLIAGRASLAVVAPAADERKIRGLLQL